MTNNQDARPFVDLKKDAEEFQDKFNEDIKECLKILDSKITALICDPDSLGNSSKSVKQNALTEFSKAKYDIFISIKSLMNAKEQEWLNYILEMKKLFIENVEIFLAGTKLEVKLPSSEFQPSLGPRKSPGNRKSTTTNSLYPRLQEIIGDKAQVNRRGRLSASPVKLASSPNARIKFFQNECSDSSESSENEVNIEDEIMDVDEDKYDHYTSQSGSVFSTRSRRSSSSDLNTSELSSKRRSNSKKEIIEDEVVGISTSVIIDSSILNPKKLGGRQISKSKKSAILQTSGDSAVNEEVVKAEVHANQVPLRGRRGRRVAKSNSTAFDQKGSASSDETTDIVKTEIHTDQVPAKGRKGKQAAKREASNITAFDQCSSDETADIVETGLHTNQVPKKGRKGRQAAKRESNNLTVISQKAGGKSGVNEEVLKAETNKVPLRGRRGKQVVENEIYTFAATLQKSSSSSDEKEQIEDIETVSNQEPLKRRRGKQAIKKDANDFTGEDIVISTARRGRSTALKNIETVSDKNVTSRMPSKSRRLAKAVIEEKNSERGTSKSPKKVSFIDGDNISDDSDIEAPIVLPTKSAGRRKTLLPKFETASGADIIPGNPNYFKSKRKTISGVSDLQTVAPSKRLKVSSLKSTSQEELNTAADNFLESDGDYSEWIALKSIDGKIPTHPAIYELKVWRAKKPAYIGSCESLRQKLTLYKLRQNTGHKHLDKFVERNYKDVQVRFEVSHSVNDAKEEVKKRVAGFVAQHKTTPAFN